MLLQRLVVVYKVPNEDALAGKTRNSLRTLKRWKSKGFPENVEIALGLLSEAGILRSTGEVADGQDDPTIALTGLAASVATLIESHRAALADLDDVRGRLDQLEAERSAAPVRPSRSGARKTGPS